MRRHRRAAVCAAVVVALATSVVLAPSAGARRAAQSTSEKPKATEVGVTATTIHIAVIADVNTPLAPGLFKGSADAVQGFGKYINSKGGLAKRKVVVDFIDSKLSADETRNAIIQACQNDFAIVGTTALFLNNVDDMVSCKDIRPDRRPGLPDIPAAHDRPVAAEVARVVPDRRPDVVTTTNPSARDLPRAGRSVASGTSRRTSTRTCTASS